MTGNCPNQVIRAFKQYRQKVSMAYIFHLERNIVFNYEYIHQNHPDPIISTRFITGHKQYLKEFAEECLKLHDDNIKHGYGYSDVNIVPRLHFDKPELFDLYYADNYQTLNNYDIIRANATNVIENIARRAHNNNDREICVKSCAAIINAVLKINLNVNLNELPHIIDYYYINSYYLNNFEDCVNILNLYDTFIDLYQQKFKELVNQRIEHIIDNTNHLYQHIKHLTPNGAICLDNEITQNEIDDYIKQGYKLFIYGDYELSTKCLVQQNPIYRPHNLKFNIEYVQEI